MHVNSFTDVTACVCILSLTFVITFSQNVTCPCVNASLCSNVKIQHTKELFTFVNGNSSEFNASQYLNWTYITTLAWEPTNFPTPSPELMCEAHSHSVRMIYGVLNKDLPFTNNQTIRLQWIEEQYSLVSNYFYDGIVFDFEDAMDMNNDECTQYTILVNETTNYFHLNMPASQISVMVPWNAYLVDGRQYDYYSLAMVSDFLYIMDYSTQSTIFDRQCIASANAPLIGMKYGIQSYLNLNIPQSKMIVGFPWFGYNYPCFMDEMESKTSKYCPVLFDNFMGFNCSDAVASTMSYAMIMNLVDLQSNITKIKMDSNTQSKYFNCYDHNNISQVNQIWFDDEYSLQLKYSSAKKMKLRGVGPFALIDIKYSNSKQEQQRTIQMWSAFDYFFL